MRPWAGATAGGLERKQHIQEECGREHGADLSYEFLREGSTVDITHTVLATA